MNVVDRAVYLRESLAAVAKTWRSAWGEVGIRKIPPDLRLKVIRGMAPEIRADVRNVLHVYTGACIVCGGLRRDRTRQPCHRCYESWGEWARRMLGVSA